MTTEFSLSFRNMWSSRLIKVNTFSHSESWRQCKILNVTGDLESGFHIIRWKKISHIWSLLLCFAPKCSNYLCALNERENELNWLNQWPLPDPSFVQYPLAWLKKLKEARNKTNICHFLITFPHPNYITSPHSLSFPSVDPFILIRFSLIWFITNI